MLYSIEFYVGGADHPEVVWQSDAPFGAIAVGDRVGSTGFSTAVMSGGYFIVEQVDHHITGEPAGSDGVRTATAHWITVLDRPSALPPSARSTVLKGVGLG